MGGVCSQGAAGEEVRPAAGLGSCSCPDGTPPRGWAGLAPVEGTPGSRAPFLNTPGLELISGLARPGPASLGRSQLVAGAVPVSTPGPVPAARLGPSGCLPLFPPGVLCSAPRPVAPFLCLRLLMSRTLFSVPGGGRRSGGNSFGVGNGSGPGAALSCLAPSVPATSPPPPARALQAAVPP